MRREEEKENLMDGCINNDFKKTASEMSAFEQKCLVVVVLVHSLSCMQNFLFQWQMYETKKIEQNMFRNEIGQYLYAEMTFFVKLRVSAFSSFCVFL